jgi:hypothetical protein
MSAWLRRKTPGAGALALCRRDFSCRGWESRGVGLGRHPPSAVLQVERLGAPSQPGHQQQKPPSFPRRCAVCGRVRGEDTGRADTSSKRCDEDPAAFELSNDGTGANPKEADWRWSMFALVLSIRFDGCASLASRRWAVEVSESGIS